MDRKDYRETLILFSPYEYLLTICVKLFPADCIPVLLDLIDRYSIIEKGESESKGIYWIDEVNLTATYK